MGMIIVANGLPFVALGDWNNSPEAIASSGWLHTIDGYVVAPEQPTCFPSHAKKRSTIDFAVVSNSLTPMIDSVYADEEDPYEPHRRVFLQMKMAPFGICEMVAQCPADFPEERPIGPCRQYSKGQVSLARNVDEHADALISRIEEELICKYHLEHVRNHNGCSPYEGRSQGFKLKKLQADRTIKAVDDPSAVLKAYRWAMQAIDRANKAGMEGNAKNACEIVVGISSKLDGCQSFSEGIPSPYTDLLQWHENCRDDRGAELDSSGLRAIHCKFTDLASSEADKMANERAMNYRKFMKYAASHKNGQIFHRILKKRPETTARPVSKTKLATTENQHHADEQIEVWAKI